MKLVIIEPLGVNDEKLLSMAKDMLPFGIIWKEDIWIEHRKMRIRDPERNLRILESMRKNGEEFGPREQYYYEMERAFARRCREAALENGQFLTRPRNERFVNGRYLW